MQCLHIIPTEYSLQIISNILLVRYVYILISLFCMTVREMFNRHVNNAQIILDFPHVKHLSIDYKEINDSFLEHLREIHPGQRDFGR